jgi:hypothetical protein
LSAARIGADFTWLNNPDNKIENTDAPNNFHSKPTANPASISTREEQNHIRTASITNINTDTNITTLGPSSSPFPPTSANFPSPAVSESGENIEGAVRSDASAPRLCQPHEPDDTAARSRAMSASLLSRFSSGTSCQRQGVKEDVFLFVLSRNNFLFLLAYL